MLEANKLTNASQMLSQWLLYKTKHNKIRVIHSFSIIHYTPAQDMIHFFSVMVACLKARSIPDQVLASHLVGHPSK